MNKGIRKRWQIGLLALAVVAAAAGLAAGRSSNAISLTKPVNSYNLQQATKYGQEAVKIERIRAQSRYVRHLVQSAPDPLAIAAMRNIAMSMSIRNGENHPSNGLAWATDRKNAQKLENGAGVNTDQPVYIILFHGNFTGYLAHTPGGGNPPTGQLMSITFDAKTLQITDWGITDMAPGLGSLGRGVSLGF
jgi:hypothetical protein